MECRIHGNHDKRRARIERIRRLRWAGMRLTRVDAEVDCPHCKATVECRVSV